MSDFRKFTLCFCEIKLKSSLGDRMRESWIFLLLASPRHGLPTAAQANRLPGRSVDFVAQVINICIKSDARILEEIASFKNRARGVNFSS